MSGRPSREVLEYSSDEDEHPLSPRRNSWRISMQAVVAANRAAKKAEEDKAAKEKAAADLAAAEEAAKTMVMTSDARHAESRTNSEARKMLARREQEKKKVAEYYANMDKVRAVQQAAIASPHGNAEKLQARLRTTRKSKELMKIEAAQAIPAA